MADSFLDLQNPNCPATGSKKTCKSLKLRLRQTKSAVQVYLLLSAPLTIDGAILAESPFEEDDEEIMKDFEGISREGVKAKSFVRTLRLVQGSKRGQIRT